MSLIAAVSDFVHPEPGTVSAICTRLIDLGTQTDKQGIKKHKIMICWEIDQKMEDGRPFLVSSRFPLNIGEKAALGKFLTAWRGRAFTAEEGKAFDLKTIVGIPCLLTLVREGDYTNVKAAAKLVKGMTPLEPSAAFCVFDLSNFQQSVFDALNDKLKETISKSPEYKALCANSKPGDTIDPNPNAHTDPNDIPF